MDSFFETTRERGKEIIKPNVTKREIDNYKQEVNSDFRHNNIPLKTLNKTTANILVAMSILAVILIAVFVSYFVWGLDNNKFKSDLSCPEVNIPQCPACNCPEVDLSKIKPSICNPNITCPSPEILIKIDDNILNYSAID